MTSTLPTASLPFRDAWLAAVLLDAGVLTAEQVRLAAGGPAGSLWEAAVTHGWATSEGVAAAVARRFGLPLADFVNAEPDAAAHVPATLARRHHIAPLRLAGRYLVAATADPRDLAAEQVLAFRCGRPVRFEVATPEAIARRLDELYRPGRDAARLVEALIAEAAGARASDLHFDPEEGALVVRRRVDGVLHEVRRLPESEGAAIVRRVKILANLDVTNPLIPADGRATARIGGTLVDLRVATAPVARRGEKAVIRLLDPANLKAGLGELGLAPPELTALRALLTRREGIVLVTGPTGSGKTTTLYAAINELRTGKVNIVTVEDPVEYELAGVSQIQVHEGQRRTFASVLRSVLRQDPDILLVGEIRDPETAATAAQAGLTGHLVLSTLHTNDAPSALVRLRDLGLDAFTLASVLQGVVAQRLVRRVCPRCAGAGCEHCDRSGYRGRIPIVEILPVTAPVARLLGDGAAPGEVADAARAEGMRSLWESGLERVRAGRTTLLELERVVGSGHGGGVGQVRERPVARILVVDDDPAIRALVRSVLARDGHSVDEAPDGFVALARADRERYDLILLDVGMPGKDGFAVLDALRTRPRGRDVPVVMLTAQGEAEALALERGVRDFVVKPVRPEVLVARVKRALEGRA